MKSSMQLHRELSAVRQTIQHMERRVEQALRCKKTLEQNPTLSMDPRGPEAYAAAADEVREDKLVERYAEQYGRPPSEQALKAELKLATDKAVRRREEANAPVVEALAELEEVAMLGAEALTAHEDKLERLLRTALPEAAQDLAAHHIARERVVNTTNRVEADHLVDEATHECLRLAAELEDTARWALTEATKAARREASVVEKCKADVQRAAQEKGRLLAKFKADDLRGTTFRGWNNVELEMGRQ